MKRFPIYSWLLDPAGIVAAIFLLQLLLWLLFMPVNPSIYGIAPRFVSAESFAKFILLFLVLWNGIYLGKLLANSLKRDELAPVEKAAADGGRIRLFTRIASLALFLSAIGEAFYVRNILFNRSLLQSALGEDGFAVIGHAVREDSITGLTSLVNLFIIPVAIYGILAIGRRYSSAIRRKYTRYLIVIGTFVLMHSFLLAARMFLVYFVSILFAIFILEYRPSSKRFFRLLIFGALLGMIIIVGGELFRFGWQQSVRLGEPLFSGRIVQVTVEYLVQAYFASDINNAFILLAAESSYQLASTAHLPSSWLTSWFGFQFYGFESVPHWSSRYGTVNVLGQWWFDMGWMAILWVFICGAGLGWLYRIVVNKRHVGISYTTLLYLISFPGFFSLSRLNYFSLSIFMLPLLYLFFTYIFAGLAGSDYKSGREEGI